MQVSSAGASTDRSLTLLFMPYPSSSGSWGSTVYLLAIAEECRRRGHHVVFHVCQPTQRMVEEAAFATIGFEGAQLQAHNAPIIDMYDVIWSLGFSDCAFLKRLLREEAGAIEQTQPDVVVSDFRLTAPISATRHQLPLVSLAAWATDPRFHGRGDDPLDRLAQELSRSWHGPAIRSMAELVFWHADRKLATSFPQFEPELADVDRLAYVGYLRRESVPREQDPVPQKWPLVVGYVSTAAWGLPRVVDSMAAVVESVGGTFWCVSRAGDEHRTISPHCRLFPYLPFQSLLPSVDALVFHGGQGTAMAALNYGVPAIVVPGSHYERRYNALRIAEMGAGVCTDVLDLRPSRFRVRLREVLKDPSYKKAALAARDLLHSYGGSAAAADIVEEAARSRRSAGQNSRPKSRRFAWGAGGDPMATG